jgi:predicted metalloprotease
MLTVLVVAASLLATGTVGTVSAASATETSATETSATETSATETSATETSATETSTTKTGQRLAGSFEEAAIDDIQAFWADALPDVYGRSYAAIPADRLFPYSSDDPPPACGTDGTDATLPYEEVAGNAFYCPVGDFVAWDVETLFPQLEERYGELTVALVLAHEWGHVVQARTESSLSATIYLENQADCFAGAWARHVDEGERTTLSIDRADLDHALGGYLEFRDPPGVDPSNEGAHGNAFDRVSAFQDGFEAGVDQCATYESDPPEVTESPFTTYEDQASGGDVSLAEAVDLVPVDLDDYWTTQLDRATGADVVSDLVVDDDGEVSCAGTSDGGVLVDGVIYCTEDDAVVYDPEALAEVYDATGDFGAGMVLAAAWSSAAQHDFGLAIEGADARLRADCLTGAWAGDVARGVRAGRGGSPDGSRGGSGDGSTSGSQLSLSPGDLDQGIATFVTLGGDAADRTDRGSAFDRVDAFRTGFFDGIEACTADAT